MHVPVLLLLLRGPHFWLTPHQASQSINQMACTGKNCFVSEQNVAALAPISCVLMSRVCEDLNNNVNIITIPNENVKCLVTSMYKYYTKNGNCKTDKTLVELLIKRILICVRNLAMHGTHLNVIVITLKCKSFTMFFFFFFFNNKKKITKCI